MRIVADTNILVRAVTENRPEQSPVAQKLLAEAELIALAMPSLCEFCWVLEQVYREDHADVAWAIRALVAAENVAVDGPAVESGLALIEADGDFADGVIAHAGKWLGGETFVSFDRKAVALLKQRGEAVLLPS